MNEIIDLVGFVVVGITVTLLDCTKLTLLLVVVDRSPKV